MNNVLEVDIDIALSGDQHIYVPQESVIRRWVEVTLAKIAYNKPAQVSIRVVDQQEIQELNNRYRHKNQATNVLSFPYEALPGTDVPLLGDVVVCAKVVEEEAGQQSKTCEQHWAHMIIHGTLHLLGYDHINEPDAEKMEALEVAILSSLNFPNPYGELTTP